MQASDEGDWQGLRAQLAAGSDTDKEFLRFLEAWVGKAEEARAAGWAEGSDTATRVATALRSALEPTEQELGRCSAHFLGQLLCVVCQHWYWGEELVSRLTPVEMRLVQDAYLLKLADLQEAAAEGDT